MTQRVIVWDIETIPDFDALRRVHDIELSDEEICSEVIKGKFPKHVFHQIVCIGAIIAERKYREWKIISRGAPNTGTRSEAALIKAFADRIGTLHPTLVTFNGHAFDLPVLRYRAMIHKISAPGLLIAPYFNRYGSCAVDLMDSLASFGQAKATLHEICRSMGLPGKHSGVDGSQVHALYKEGRVQEISDYCSEDVTNTYRLWLRHELFCGRLSNEDFERSDTEAVVASEDTTTLSNVG